MAAALSIPATFATAFGFIFSYGKLLHAMAESKLIPVVCGYTIGEQKTPYVAILLGSLVSYGINLLVFFAPVVGPHLFNICMLSACSAYITQCVGYMFVRRNFDHLPREFKSPLGLFGPCYSIAVFSLGIVSIIGFQGDNQVAFISFLCICAVFSLYYFLVAKKIQTFSPDENKILLKAHVVIHNTRKHKQTSRSHSQENSSRSRAMRASVESNGGRSISRVAPDCNSGRAVCSQNCSEAVESVRIPHPTDPTDGHVPCSPTDDAKGQSLAVVDEKNDHEPDDVNVPATRAIGPNPDMTVLETGAVAYPAAP